MCHYKVGFPSGSSTNDKINITVRSKYSTNQLSIVCASSLSATPNKTISFAKVATRYQCDYPFSAFILYYSNINATTDFEIDYAYYAYVPPPVPVVVNKTNETLANNTNISANSNITNSSAGNETEGDSGFQIDKTSMYIGLAAGGTVLVFIGFIGLVCWICYCKRKWPDWKKAKAAKAARMKEIHDKKL